MARLVIATFKMPVVRISSSTGVAAWALLPIPLAIVAAIVAAIVVMIGVTMGLTTPLAILLAILLAISPIHVARFATQRRRQQLRFAPQGLTVSHANLSLHLI